jgi:hypothetical protein
MKLCNLTFALIAVLFIAQVCVIQGTTSHEYHHNDRKGDHAHARDQHVAQNSDQHIDFNEQPDVCSDCCNGINMEACAAVSCPPCEPSNICADCCRGINVEKCIAVLCLPCDEVLAAEAAAGGHKPCDKAHDEPTEVVHENICGICCSGAAANNKKCQTVSDNSLSCSAPCALMC